MTSTVVPQTANRSVVLHLARLESRRLTLHPAMLVGWGLLLFMLTVNILDKGPVMAFDMVTTGTTFYPGLFCVLAAHMVTTRDRRAGTEDLLGSVPATREQRMLALFVAAWVPALLALIANFAIRQYFVWQDVFVEVPGLAHVIQGPVTVLGGSLLGIMLGLWLPQRATPVLSMVGLIAVSIALGSVHNGAALAPLVSWADWGPTDGTVWYALEPGNPGAHVVYLLGLCGMAAAAASLRVTPRRLPAVGIGFVCLALAVWGGVSQLP